MIDTVEPSWTSSAIMHAPRARIQGACYGPRVEYELMRPLAEGSRHWLARHRELDRTVVLKQMRREELADPEAYDRFNDEARIAAAVPHLYIVRVLDTGLGEGLPWIAFELVPGPSLREVLAHARPDRSAVRAILDMAAAVEALHAAGIVHRDLRPENVLGVGGTGRSSPASTRRSGSSRRSAPRGPGYCTVTPSTPRRSWCAASPRRPRATCTRWG
jgi:hypothetical protein